MMHHVRGTFAGVMVFLPFLLRETSLPSVWKWSAAAVCVFVAYILTIWDLKPDKRIDKIRRLNLDDKLKDLLRDAESKVAAGQRSPIRVNVMIRRRRWFGWPTMSMVYGYGMKTTDPDFGLSWLFPYGLCWHTYRRGAAAFWREGVDGLPKVRMTKAQRARTRHVKAVISLPVRSAHGKDGDMRSTVSAVLNIDAISTEAAQELQMYWEVIAVTGDHPLLDLADYAGIYC